MFKKTKLFVIALLAMLCVSLVFVACDNQPQSGGNASTDNSTAYTGEYDIRLTAIGSTTIKAGKTLQIRASVTGTTEKDVTFTSDDESIATVAANGLVTKDWDAYDMRQAITKTPLVGEDEIKCAIQQVYRGFLQPRALWHRLTSTRTMFDFGFYYRGVRSLIGHLTDFRTQKVSRKESCCP